MIVSGGDVAIKSFYIVIDLGRFPRKHVSYFMYKTDEYIESI